MLKTNLRETIYNMIPGEDTYAAQIESSILPFLDSRKQELWLARDDEPDQKLYCAKYTLSRDDNDCRGVVVISHGYTENTDKYREVIYYFLKMGYHVYMPDHCSHGRSYRLTADPSIVHVDRYERYIEDFLSVSHRAKADHETLPLYVYSHSMGGAIAAAAAAWEPGLFSKMILSSPMIQPDTSPLPWKMAIFFSGIACRLGKASHYLPGGHPFDGSDEFELSSSVSKARFDYQQNDRRANPQYQNSCGSYGWTYNAGKLCRFLTRTAWKRICIPLLLFQAEDDFVVSAKAQYRFMRKISRLHCAPVWLIKVPESRHEIYNAKNETLVKYWTKVFRFLN